MQYIYVISIVTENTLRVCNEWLAYLHDIV